MLTGFREASQDIGCPLFGGGLGGGTLHPNAVEAAMFKGLDRLWKSWPSLRSQATPVATHP